jgi:hypothetical protein
MSNVSPQDVADAKARAKQTKAYNAATKKMADGGLTGAPLSPVEAARRRAMLAAAMQGAGTSGLGQAAQQAGVAQSIPNPTMPAQKRGGSVKRK